MTTAEYLERAAQADDKARRAATAQLRDEFHSVALAWRKLAALAEATKALSVGEERGLHA